MTEKSMLNSKASGSKKIIADLDSRYIEKISTCLLVSINSRMKLYLLHIAVINIFTDEKFPIYASDLSEIVFEKKNHTKKIMQINNDCLAKIAFY